MKKGVAPFLGSLIILVAFADCARDVFMPSADDAEGTHPLVDNAFILHKLEKLSKNDLPSSVDFPTDLCHSCLEIPRKAKKILSDPALFYELASMSCHIAPSDLEAECTKMVEMYQHEAAMFLQEIVTEENFCSNTGCCPQESSSPTSAMEHMNEMLTKMQKGSPMEVVTKFLNGESSLMDNDITLEWGSNRTCNACQNVLNKIRNELEDPDKQLRLVASLLKACETEVFVYRCKKLVFAYGPLLISNLQKIVSMDLCRMVHICVDPKNQTNPVYEQFGRHLPGAIAKLDLM